MAAAKAASPELLSREGTEERVSRGCKLVERSKVKPSLVSRSRERRRGQNRRQPAAAGSDAWPALAGRAADVSLGTVGSACQRRWLVQCPLLSGLAPVAAGGDAGAGARSAVGRA